MPLTDKQRNLISFRLHDCDLAYGTEQDILKIADDRTLGADDGNILVDCIVMLEAMRHAKRFGKYDQSYGPNEMENAMKTLHDTITRYNESKKTV
jgi:hypothetical protein